MAHSSGNKFKFPHQFDPQKVVIHPHFPSPVVVSADQVHQVSQPSQIPFTQPQNFAPLVDYPQYHPQQVSVAPTYSYSHSDYAQPQYQQNPGPVWQSPQPSQSIPPVTYANPPLLLNYGEPVVHNPTQSSNYYFQNAPYVPLPESGPQVQSVNYSHPSTTPVHHPVCYSPAPPPTPHHQVFFQDTSSQQTMQKEEEETAVSHQHMEVQTEEETEENENQEDMESQDENQNEGNVNCQPPMEVQSEKEAVLNSEIVNNQVESQSTEGTQKDNEVGPQNVETTTEDLNSEDANTSDDVQIIEDSSPPVFQDKKSESENISEMQIIKDTHPIVIDPELQEKDSEPSKTREVEIIEEPPRHPTVIVERIDIDDSSDSSEDNEFENVIASVVDEAFVDNDSSKTNDSDKRPDEPVIKSSTGNSKDYESDSSNDEEFEKVIGNAVEEAFKDNTSLTSTGEKDDDIRQNKEKANEEVTVVEDISQDQITDSFDMNVVEMSIDIPQNEDTNEVSRDDMVRKFSQKKFQVECPPEPSASTSAAPPQEENGEFDHQFSFTVSYYDSKDKRNCANYVESVGRLYISKDYAFQLLCSAVGVPPGSFLRAVVYFEDPALAHTVVNRCKMHRAQDQSNGRKNAKHMLQSTHEAATYEIDESERYCVLIPYQCSQTPFQGSAELSCYTYKFGCYSSCYTKVKQKFKVHFTLEKDGKQLGKQILDVKVCKLPENDANQDIINPIPVSTCGMLQDFLIPNLNSKTYGDRLYWGKEFGVFYLKWTHKSNLDWSVDELNVFKDWDNFKGRNDEIVTHEDAVTTKQRVRSALKSMKNIKELRSEKKGYKKYIITSSGRKFLAAPQEGGGLSRARRHPKRPLSSNQGERRTTKRKVDPIAYEETGDDIDGSEEDIYAGEPGAEPPAKKMRLLPSPNAPKKRRRPTPYSSSRRRPPPKSAPRRRPPPKRVPPVQKFDFEDGFKKENFTPKVELERLTLQDMVQAGIKKEKAEQYMNQSKVPKKKMNRLPPKSTAKSVPPPKSVPTPKSVAKSVPPPKSVPTPKSVAKSVPPPKSAVRKSQPKKIADRPVAATNPEPARQLPPLEQNVYSGQNMNIEATPYQVPSAPPPLSMLNWKEEEKPNQMLNTYANIKTQGDMIVAVIRAVLPSLPGEKVSQVYDFLAEMGVENANDLAFIEEDDLNAILKPIQSRKLIAAWRNKGVPSHSSSLPRRTCVGSEPVTFVPAVFQIQNMAAQNQINDTHKAFPSQTPSSERTPNSNSQTIHIPGWRQSTPAPPPSVQDVYPDLGGSLKPPLTPHREVPLPLKPLSPKEEGGDWADDFVIPWEKLPSTIENALLRKQRPTRQQRFDIVNTVCNKIFPMVKHPAAGEVTKIAQKMCDRFPESLCDEGTAKGFRLLDKQLKNRMTNLRSRGLKETADCEQWPFLKKALKDSKSSPRTSSTTANTANKSASVQSSRANSTTAKKATARKSVPLSASYITAVPSAISRSLSTDGDTMPTSLPQLNPSSDTSMVLSENCPDFDIPWHKVDIAILNLLHKKQKLAEFHRANLARCIVEQFEQWKPNPPNLSADMRKIAEQMRLKFPLSLSNFALGQEGGKGSSQALAKILRNRFYRNNTLKKKRKNEADERVGEEDSVSGGIQEWAIDFRVPWEKLPPHLLECLKRRERLTPTLRQEMVRVISQDILSLEESPDQESLDFIAKKVCSTYPKSLCDMSGDKVTNNHDFLGRQLLWRIQRVNYAQNKGKGDNTDNRSFPDTMDNGSFVDVNTLPEVVDTSSMYYQGVWDNSNLGVNTATYSRNASAASGSGSSTFYDGTNNFAPPMDYMAQLEHMIKKEVTEPDPRFGAARMQEESEEIL